MVYMGVGKTKRLWYTCDRFLYLVLSHQTHFINIGRRNGPIWATVEAEVRYTCCLLCDSLSDGTRLSQDTWTFPSGMSDTNKQCVQNPDFRGIKTNRNIHKLPALFEVGAWLWFWSSSFLWFLLFSKAGSLDFPSILRAA